MTWLSKTDLANLNSGESVGNVTELKLYANQQKPYVSGQSIRRALFDTVARSNPERFLCSPETPCGDVANCWSCDLRGFLATEKGSSGTRRWSPVKVSPGLGQVESNIVQDLLTRHSEVEKKESEKKDSRIAHVQMTENIYRCNVVLDLANVGIVREPIIEDKKKAKKEEKEEKAKQLVKGYKTTIDIPLEEKVARTHAILDAVYHLNGFAKQARSAASLAPEIMLLAMQDTYNQRGLDVLDLNNQREISVKKLATVLKEHQLLGNKLVVGWTPEMVANEEEILQLFEEYRVPVMTVLEGILWAKEQIRDQV